MSNPSPRLSPYGPALAAIALSAWAALWPAEAEAGDLVSSSDCAGQQAEMRARGWDAAEIQRQLTEPNGIGADRFDEFLDAFRGGIKASQAENDLMALASYRLGVCAFETASLRSKIAAGSKSSGGLPPGERVAPKTAAPAPVTVNAATPRTTGFVAPPKSDMGQPLAPTSRKAGAGSADPDVVTPPRLMTDNASLITPDDYPVASIRQQEQGAVGFRVTVSASGAPTNCAIIASSGFPDLDSLTCALVMQRARFEPAKTASGRAAPATFQQKVRWTLPE